MMSCYGTYSVHCIRTNLDAFFEHRIWQRCAKGIWNLCRAWASFVLLALSSVSLRDVTDLLQASGAITLFSQLSEQIVFWLNPSVLACTEAMRQLISVTEVLPWSEFGDVVNRPLGCLLEYPKELGVLYRIQKNMLDRAYILGEEWFGMM